jgi:hypothetical protein
MATAAMKDDPAASIAVRSERWIMTRSFLSEKS